MKSRKDIFIAVCTLLAVFFTLSATAQTEKDDPIDVTYHSCVAKDSSVGNIEACAFVAYGKWNKEMENAANKLTKEFKKPNEKAAFKQSQLAWKAYRDAEFKSYDNMFNCPGGKYCLLRQNGRIDVVRTRTQQLRAYIESLKVARGRAVKDKK